VLQWGVDKGAIHMLIMTGASASGKTEIAKILIQKHGFQKMITYTTRPMRDNEKNGLDYHFITIEDFIEKTKQNFFIETTVYNNHYYGTAFQDAAADKVLIVDTFGANELFERLGTKAVFFYLESKAEIRKERMIMRGDRLGDIKKRLENDAIFFQQKNMVHIDYIIDTNTAGLDELASKINLIYQSHQKKQGSL